MTAIDKMKEWILSCSANNNYKVIAHEEVLFMCNKLASEEKASKPTIPGQTANTAETVYVLSVDHICTANLQ